MITTTVGCSRGAFCRSSSNISSICSPASNLQGVIVNIILALVIVNSETHTTKIHFLGIVAVNHHRFIFLGLNTCRASFLQRLRCFCWHGLSGIIIMDCRIMYYHQGYTMCRYKPPLWYRVKNWANTEACVFVSTRSALFQEEHTVWISLGSSLQVAQQLGNHSSQVALIKSWVGQSF